MGRLIFAVVGSDPLLTEIEEGERDRLASSKGASREICMEDSSSSSLSLGETSLPLSSGGGGEVAGGPISSSSPEGGGRSVPESIGGGPMSIGAVIWLGGGRIPGIVIGTMLALGAWFIALGFMLGGVMLLGKGAILAPGACPGNPLAIGKPNGVCCCPPGGGPILAKGFPGGPC